MIFSSENVNIEYVCMLVCQKNMIFVNFWWKNGPNFNKNSTKLRNKALIGKKCRNKTKTDEKMWFVFILLFLQYIWSKLHSEALIGKKSMNKSWRKLNLSSENLNIEYVCILVCQKIMFFFKFWGKCSNFQQNLSKTP